MLLKRVFTCDWSESLDRCNKLFPDMVLQQNAGTGKYILIYESLLSFPRPKLIPCFIKNADLSNNDFEHLKQKVAVEQRKLN